MALSTQYKGTYQMNRVHEMLRHGGPRRGVTAVQFVRNYILRYSAVIFKLKAKRHLEIETQPIKGKPYCRYILKWEP